MCSLHLLSASIPKIWNKYIFSITHCWSFCVCSTFWYSLNNFLQSPPKGATIPYRPKPAMPPVIFAGGQAYTVQGQYAIPHPDVSSSFKLEFKKYINFLVLDKFRNFENEWNLLFCFKNFVNETDIYIKNYRLHKLSNCEIPSRSCVCMWLSAYTNEISHLAVSRSGTHEPTGNYYFLFMYS